MNQPKANLSIDKKLFYSFFITPAVPAAIFSAISLGNIIVFGVSFIGAYLVAGAHVLVFGVPAFLLGKRLNSINWWTCIIAGFIIGVGPIAIWQGSPKFVDWGIFGLFGASGGAAFWLLWQYWVGLDQKRH